MTTYEMQICDWQVAYDGAGCFEFPFNPQVITFPLTMDRAMTEVPFGLHHIVYTGGGVKGRELVLTGSFKGSNRLVDYNGLAAKVIARDMCRLYLNSDCFYYVIGTGVRQSLVAQKNNFVDYVATFMAMSPFVYSTARSWSNALSPVTNANAFNTSALTNTGNANSVAKITVQNQSSGDITKVEVGDSGVVAGEVAGSHKVVWTGSLSAGSTLVIYPFKLWNASGSGDTWGTRFAHSEIGGVQSGNSYTPGGSVPQVTAGTSSQVFSVKLTGCTGTTVVTLNWFDANVG